MNMSRVHTPYFVCVCVCYLFVPFAFIHAYTIQYNTIYDIQYCILYKYAIVWRRKGRKHKKDHDVWWHATNICYRLFARFNGTLSIQMMIYFSFLRQYVYMCMIMLWFTLSCFSSISDCKMQYELIWTFVIMFLIYSQCLSVCFFVIHAHIFFSFCVNSIQWFIAMSVAIDVHQYRIYFLSIMCKNE